MGHGGRDVLEGGANIVSLYLQGRVEIGNRPLIFLILFDR